jgi:hypothetical protein
MNNIDLSSEKSFGGGGSNPFDKNWANELLSSGVVELKNSKRVLSARLMEVRYYIRRLEEEGFWWQSERLKNHLHRFYQSLQNSENSDTPPRGEEEVSS